MEKRGGLCRYPSSDSGAGQIRYDFPDDAIQAILEREMYFASASVLRLDGQVDKTRMEEKRLIAQREEVSITTHTLKSILTFPGKL